LASGSGPSVKELFFTGNPQPLRGKPQSDSRDGENYRKPADNQLFVALENVIGRGKKDFDTRVKSGAIFWFIVIGGLLTVLWLYQAQR
jgi:hypothetical protein